jgi:hypothetical protein
VTEQPQNSRLEEALREGELDLQGQFLLGSNYTFLVTVHHADAEHAAVYKPSRGERPLWDFPDNTLAQREVAAYMVSEALGLQLVPCTVLREDIPVYGPGSVQQYIDYDPDYHYFNFTEEDKRRLPPVVLFDLLINNADRKGSHVLIEKDTGKLWAIDHGLCFHEEEKLRTVLWDSAGEPIPEKLRGCLAAVQRLLEPAAPLRLGLAPYLADGEIEAMRGRARQLLEVGIFPTPPPDRRAFPYPPI